MKKLIHNSYSIYVKNSKILNNYLLSKFNSAKFLKSKKIYTISILFSFKKNFILQITGFCKSFIRIFSKGCSFHIVYTYGKSYIFHIFSFYSPKFLNFMFNT
jgi:hypothetical protein